MGYRKKLLSLVIASQFAIVQISYGKRLPANIQEDLIPLQKSLVEMNMKLSLKEKSNSLRLAKNPYLALWKEVRDQFSPSTRSLGDAWALKKRSSNEKPPTILQSTVTQTDGRQALRATIEFAGSRSVSMDLSLDAETGEFFVNKKPFAELQSEDLDQFVKNFSKLLGLDASGAKGSSGTEEVIKLSETQHELDAESFASLTQEDRARYFILQRQLLELSQKVLKESKSKDKGKSSSAGASDHENGRGRNFHAFAWRFMSLFGSQSHADVSSPANESKGIDQCLNRLGYLVKVDNRGLCPDTDGSKPNVSKQVLELQKGCADQSASLCNPSYYGVKRDSATLAGLCLSKSDLESGKTCSAISPLQNESDVKALVASMANFKAEGPNPSGPAHTSDFITQALAVCEAQKEKSQKEKSQSCKDLTERKALMNRFNVEALNSSTPPAGGPPGGPGGAAANQPPPPPQRPDIAQNLKPNDGSSVPLKPSRLANQELIAPEAAGRDLAEQRNKDCGFFCSVGKWMASKQGIIAMMAGIAVTGLAARHYYKKGKRQERERLASASTSSSSTTQPITSGTTPVTLPTRPTNPDYTGAER